MAQDNDLTNDLVNTNWDGQTVDDNPGVDSQTTTAPVAVEPQAPQAPAFDEEAFTNKIMEKFAETLNPKKEEAEDYRAPWIKENRNPKDWTEFHTWDEQEKRRIAREEYSSFVKQQNDDRAAQEQAQSTAMEKANKDVDTWLNRLEKTGEVPAIKDANDARDAGVKARNDIMQGMLLYNQQNPKEMYTNLVEYYHAEYKPNRTIQSIGAKAPVAGASGAGISSGKELSYEDLHKVRDYSELR